MIHFPFNFNKALQAVCYVLATAPEKRMNYTKLLKLLYIADREMLKAKGRPITCDTVVAMPNGPVLDTIYGMIKGAVKRFSDSDVPFFGRFVEGVDDFEVRLLDDPGTGLLSEIEIKILRKVTDQYKNHSFQDMIDICHQFPEWRKNDPGDSMKPLPIEDILIAVGCKDWIDRIREESAMLEAASHTFGPLRA